MSAALHLAREADADRLDALASACRAEMEIAAPDDTRRAALLPLLEGSPHGAVYLIGPARAPVGYAVVTFGWSLEQGGMTGTIDELYMRPPVRGRGIATEVLLSLAPALAEAGLRALHLRADAGNEAARRLCARAGFVAREGYMTLTRPLS